MPTACRPYYESNTSMCLGDSLDPAAATVVLVIFPDLRWSPNSRQAWDQNSPKSVLALGVPVAVSLENRAAVGVNRVPVVAVCARSVA